MDLSDRARNICRISYCTGPGCQSRQSFVRPPVLVHHGLQDIPAAGGDKHLLLLGELLFPDERFELLNVVDHPDVLLERDRRLFSFGLHPDFQVEEVLADFLEVLSIDALPVLPAEPVERHLRHRVRGQGLPLHPCDDLGRDVGGVHVVTFDRPAVGHRRLREVEVPDRVRSGVHEQAALLVGDLAVRQKLRRARVPRVVRDLHLPVVVAERDVIEGVGEDGVVEFMLRDLHEPFVFDGGRKPVGHEHVCVAFAEFDFVEFGAVVLRYQHVREEVEDGVPDLYVFVPELVGRRDVCGVVGEDLEWGDGVPGLDHAVVAGDYYERDAGFVEPVEGF